MFPLASRMPVSMASLFRSDSVKPFKNSSSYGTRGGGVRGGGVRVCGATASHAAITEQPHAHHVGIIL